MTHKSLRQRHRAVCPAGLATPVSNAGAHPEREPALYDSAADAAGSNRKIHVRSDIVYVATAELKRPNRTLRTRKQAEIDKAATAIEVLSYDPAVLARRDGRVVHNDHYLAAYLKLGRSEVPVIFIDDRTEGEIAALKLWLDRAEHGGEIDRTAQFDELSIVIESDTSLLDAIGSDMGEIDVIVHGAEEARANVETQADASAAAREAQRDVAEAMAAPGCTEPGDVWIWPAGHRLICGNARDPKTYTVLMGGKTARLVVTDVPYGTKIAGMVSSKHGEFIEGSNQTEEEMVGFFNEAYRAMLPAVAPGAWVFTFIDWKSLYGLTTAIRQVGLQQKSLIVVDKTVANRGSLYKNQAEFVVLCKWGDAPSVNNVQMGRYGRSRSNIWPVMGYAGFRPDRKEALAAHPTVKPLGCLLPALLDASNIGDIVLDPFCGSGSLILAAERVKRIAYCSELDPKYVDVAVHRMHKLTGEYPVHADLGISYPDVLAGRLAAAVVAAADGAEG